VRKPIEFSAFANASRSSNVLVLIIRQPLLSRRAAARGATIAE